MNIKKAVALILFCSLLPGFFISCIKTTSDKMSINIGGTTYKVNSYNKALDGQKLALFDRNYRGDDDSLAIMTKGAVGYKLITVFTKEDGSVSEFDIIDSDSSEYLIPTNGFLLFTKRELPSGFDTISVDAYNAPEYIDLTKAAVLTSDGKSGIKLHYKDCAGFPEQNINIIMQPNTTFFVSEIPENFYPVNVKRKNGGFFTVEETGVEKYGNKYFTLVFGDEYSIAFAKKTFRKGCELQIVNSSMVSEYGDEKTVLLDEKPFSVKSVNSTDLNENGVYIYDINFGSTSLPVSDRPFVDLVVLGERVIYKGGTNERVVVPDYSGYIIRFFDESVRDTQDIKVGASCRTVLFECESLPLSYVKIGDLIVEVGDVNKLRSSKDTGFLYTPDYYSLSTVTSELGIEVAVSNSVVTQVNPANLQTSGDTTIPQDGFVLSVYTGSYYAKSLSKVKVGDKAEYVENKPLYSLKKFAFTDLNTLRTLNSLIIYTSEFGKSTKTSGTGIEVCVDGNGQVLAVYSDKGNNTIPADGGFILSAYGVGEDALALIKEGSVVFYDTDNKTVYVAETPKTVLNSFAFEAEELREKYNTSAKKFYNIDYDSIDKSIKRLEEIPVFAQKALKDDDIDSYADLLYEGKTLLDTMKYAFIPSVKVQNREAWVTIAELTSGGEVLVHINSEEDVVKYIAYAKKMKLNALIIDGFAMSYSLYDSDIEGVLRLEQLKDFDCIESFVRNGHEQGIEIHVLVCAFAGGDASMVFPEGHYMNIYKDKYLLTNKGNTKDSYNSITLDMYDAEIREFQLKIFSEIVTKYDIDGLQVDYIRFPLPNYYQADDYEDYGYNEKTLAAFKARYGVNPIDLKITDSLWDEWCDFRKDIISSFVKSTYQTVKSIKSDITLSFTCFADYRDRQIYVYQDVEKWCENGWVDTLYPMIYTKDTQTRLGYAKNLAETLSKKSRLTLGIGAYVVTSEQYYMEQCYMSHELAADGISIFTLRYISTCGYNYASENGVFRNEAVRTNQGKITFTTGINELIYSIDNVYKRFDKENAAIYDGIKTELAKLLKSAESVSDDEDFATFAIKELTSINNSFDNSASKALEKLDVNFDFLINCFIREQNITERNAMF